MKFQEYLTEAIYTKESFDEAWANIVVDCDEYIKVLKNVPQGRFLWRGTNKRIKTFKKIKPRKDRLPKDTPEETHYILDELFKKYHGWRARSEGTFAVGKKNVSIHYGDPYLFFPANGYKFLWNPNIEDLWGEISDEGLNLEENPEDEYNYEIEYGEGLNGEWKYDEIYTGTSDRDEAIEMAADAEGISFDDVDETLLEWVPELTFEEWIEEKDKEWLDHKEGWFDHTVKKYKSKNLNNAIKSGHEIMFKCKFYYLLSPEFEKYAEKEIWKVK